jgi:hypothetical protein
MDRATRIHGVMRNVYTTSAGKPKGKKPFGRPRIMWNNIMELREREREGGGVVWTGLTWLRIGTFGFHKM